MGRYSFIPARVRSTATTQMSTGIITAPPPWYSVVGDIPPPQLLVRPLQHVPKKLKKNTKPSRMFQPAQIKYPEDNLRKQFFQDHPWELARPRIVLEDDGKDATRVDWSKGINQPGRALDGERLVKMYELGHKLTDIVQLVSSRDKCGSCKTEN